MPPGLPSALLDRRPDIRAAEQNLVAANAIIGVARAAYFPRISLTGLLGFQSDQLSSLFTGPARVWQFVPQVTQPIFNAGRLRSNVELAKAQQQIALIQYERVIQTAFREVRTRSFNTRRCGRFAPTGAAGGDTPGSIATVLGALRGGIDTLLNALDADRDLFDAELGLAQTRGTSCWRWFSCTGRWAAAGSSEQVARPQTRRGTCPAIRRTRASFSTGVFQWRTSPNSVSAEMERRRVSSSS